MQSSRLRAHVRLLLREPTLRIGGATLLLCLVYALAHGRGWAQEEEARLAAVRSDVDAAIAGKRDEVAEIEAGRQSLDEHPYAGSPLDYHAAATLPVDPLAALAVGQRDLQADAVEVTLWGREDTLLARRPLADPEQLQLGRFDAAFVVVYLLPLLVIGLCFDLLAGERERGTLRLVLAQPISAASYLRAKLAARVLAVLAGLGLFGAIAALALGTGAAPALLGWLAVAALYAGFWAALAFAINARRRSAAANAMTLAAAWVTLVLLLPATINVVVEQALPLPSRTALIGELRAADNRAAAQVHDHPELTGEDAFAWARKYYRVQRKIEEETAPRFAAFEAQVAARADVVRAASLLSPAVLVHDALGDLAGTGAARHAAFAAQTRAFADELHAELSPRLFAGRRLASHEYDGLPRFAFAEESPSQSAARLVPPLLLLLAASAGLLLWGDRRLRRGDPPVEEGRG